MVTAPLRWLVVGLEATVYEAVPLPVPAAVVEIQETALDATQLQPVPAVTPTLAVPPVAAMEALAAERE